MRFSTGREEIRRRIDDERNQLECLASEHSMAGTENI